MTSTIAHDEALSSPPPSPSRSFSASGSPMRKEIATGRWTPEEHELFVQALQVHRNANWRKIATIVATRTPEQVRTHAQKYFQKLQKQQRRGRSYPQDKEYPYYQDPAPGLTQRKRRFSSKDFEFYRPPPRYAPATSSTLQSAPYKPYLAAPSQSINSVYPTLPPLHIALQRARH